MVHTTAGIVNATPALVSPPYGEARYPAKLPDVATPWATVACSASFGLVLEAEAPDAAPAVARARAAIPARVMDTMDERRSDPLPERSWRVMVLHLSLRSDSSRPLPTLGGW